MRMLRVGTVAELEPTWELKVDDNVWTIGISKDGKLVVIGSWDNSAYGVNREGERIWQHKTSDYVKGVGISRDGELVVVGSYDRYIYAIKGSGKLSWRYKTENYVRAVAVSSDGEYVAAGSWRGTLYFLDKRGKLLWKHRIGSAILDLAVSVDGAVVVAGCEDGSVHSFELSGAQKWTYKAAGAVTNVAVSGDGDRVFVCAKDTIMARLTAKGEPLWRFHIGGISKGLNLVQGDEIAVVFTDNNFLQYVDAKGELMFMRRLPEEVWEGTVAEDGITIVVATKDNRAMMFEVNEFGQVVLEGAQQTIERIVADGVDVTKPQEMHQKAGDLLANNKVGEAIQAVLEAVALAQKMRTLYIDDQANTIIQEVEDLVAGNPDLDMRKAVRFLTKARTSLQEELVPTRLDRALFYARLAMEAAEASVENKVPMVQDELFQASLGAPVEVDEAEVNRLLGISLEEIVQDVDMGTGAAAEAEVAEAISEAARKEAEFADKVAGEIEGEAGTSSVAEPEPEEAEQAEVPPEAAEEAEAAEAAVEGQAPQAEGGPCPECGEDVGLYNNRCKRCYSKEVMTLAVEQAKRAHKDGQDISALAPDLKSVKVAWQGRDFDTVISTSESILSRLEEIIGISEKVEEAASEGTKVKKKKKRLR